MIRTDLLIDIFSVISGGEIGNASALSGGIAEALITTVTGLGIAVPLILAYQHLNSKIDTFITSLKQLNNDIIQHCKGLQR